MTSQSVCTNGHGTGTVVIDVGSRFFRGGLAGNEGPTCEIPTTTPDKDGQSPTGDISPVSGEGVGMGVVERGVVRDWERVETLLTSVYSHLHPSPPSSPTSPFPPHSLLLTRPVHGSVVDAERFVQVGLETLGASAVYLGVQPVLTLYASGGTDGVVLDCGEGLTQVVPIYQGYAVDHAIRRQDLAGRDVSAVLQSLMANRNIHVDKETAREMKERLCYVFPTSELPEAEVTKVAKTYTLPNGDSISVQEERYRTPEVLFRPSQIGSECLGLPALLHKSISDCPIDVRSCMYERIIMAGGTTRMPGICRRVLREVSSLSPKSRVKVVAGAGRQHSAWRGGSVLACLPSFPQMAVTHQEYQEQGAAIVRKKFLWT